MTDSKPPKWSERRKQNPNISCLNVPVLPGPGTDREALSRELQACTAKVIAGEYESNEAAVADVRTIAARYGARVGDTFDSAKLSGTLREVVELGARIPKLCLWREGDGAQRWFIGDCRWIVFIDASQVPMIVAAGVTVVETAADEWPELEGDAFDVSDFAVNAADILDELGPVAERRGCPQHVATIGEDLFPLDSVAVLCRMGVVRVVVEESTLEGHDHAGRIVGYCRALNERPAASA